MKTTAQSSAVVSFGSWFRKMKAVVHREAALALKLHLEICATMAESYRRK
jgi:hypothetical protein